MDFFIAFVFIGFGLFSAQVLGLNTDQLLRLVDPGREPPRN